MSITTNLALNAPAYNSTSPTWDQPLNYNTTILDQMYGNTTSVAVSTSSSTTNTNIAAPSATASGSTSQAMRFNLTGALSANQNVLLPQSVAGMWIVSNNTTNAFTLTLGSNNGSNVAAGATVACSQGSNILVYCDGTNVNLVSNAVANNSISPAKLALGAWTTVASAATVDLGAQTSRNIIISGTTGITSLGSTATPDNVPFNIRFSGNLTLTNSANLICPGAANLSVAAGDTFTVVQESTGVWRIIAYSLSALPAVNGSLLTGITKLSTATGAAPSYSARAWINFDMVSLTIRESRNVSSLTYYTTGACRVNFTTAMPTANYCVVMSSGRNGADPAALSAWDRLSNKDANGFEINTTFSTAVGNGYGNYESINSVVFA